MKSDSSGIWKVVEFLSDLKIALTDKEVRGAACFYGAVYLFGLQLVLGVAFGVDPALLTPGQRTSLVLVGLVSFVVMTLGFTSILFAKKMERSLDTDPRLYEKAKGQWDG